MKNNRGTSPIICLNLTGSAPSAPTATLTGDFKPIKSHYKTSNKLACSPHGYKVNQTHGGSLREGALGYWSAEHLLLFNLIAQKPASNNNEWRVAA